MWVVNKKVGLLGFGLKSRWRERVTIHETVETTSVQGYLSHYKGLGHSQETKTPSGLAELELGGVLRPKFVEETAFQTGMNGVNEETG